MTVLWSSLFLVLIIIAWLFTGGLAGSFYASRKENHLNFRFIYTIAVLNVFQAVLAFYYVTTGNSALQESRWVAFTLIQTDFFGLVTRGMINRPWELTLRAFYFVLLLLSISIDWLPVTYILSSILIFYAYFSPEPLIKKYYTPAFVLWIGVEAIPALFGYTGVASLGMGVVFSAYFAFATYMVWKSEKVLEAIEERKNEKKTNTNYT
jgi:hypothetical protein